VRGPDAASAAPLRTQIFESFIALAVCPVLVLGIGLGRVFTGDEERGAQRQLVERVGIIGARITAYVTAHERAAQAIALRLAGSGTERREVERLLVSAHRLYPAFDKLVAIDRTGNATGGSMFRGDRPVPMPAVGFVGDKPYFVQPMRSGLPFRSGVFATRDADKALAVVIGTAMSVGAADRAGVVKASLSLREVGRIAGDLVDLSATTLVVTDERGVVITAAGVDAPAALTHVGGTAWVRSTELRTAGEYHAPAEPTRPGARYITARFDMPDLQWRVFIRRPVAQVQLPAVRFYTVTAGLVFCSLLLAVPLAGLTAGRVSHPLERLAAETRGVGTGIAVAWTPAEDPRAPTEVQALHADLTALVARLRERDAELRQAVADRERANQELGKTLEALETRVRDRTIALAETSRRAELATRAKGEFLANMSHEIRTPMNGVIALADLLVAAPLDPQQRELALTIRASGRQLLGVINDILDLSKIESGRLTLEAAPYAPRLVVSEVLREAAAAVGGKRVHLHERVADDVPEWLLGDGLRVRQILHNLLGNAVKFTAQGEVRVRVSVASEGRAEPMVRFEVSDTGIGIEPDRMAQIFQPFELGDASMTRRFGGTGLGLAISTRLADMLGGWLRGSSVPGEGATFTLELPLRPASPPSGASHRTADPNPAAPATVRHQVLIADDDAVSRQVAAHLVARLGHEVRTTADARTLVDGSAPVPADVVLMDLEMPGLDGLSAARALRATGTARRPWIIGVSAHAASEARADALAAGMNDYVAKPLTLDVLAAAFARVAPPA
jgi:signal transduction histidine kinase